MSMIKNNYRATNKSIDKIIGVCIIQKYKIPIYYPTTGINILSIERPNVNYVYDQE